ncbi:MAG: hypothetical protein MUD01_02650, partial [Chloroflexaceae bacterium]|nr:hypothetical protein [Chloroflexaceae bacterium]
MAAISAPQITALNVTNLTCASTFGQVFIQATTSGGGALQYSLDGGITSQSSPLFQNLVAGEYTVTVTDQQNCNSFSNFSLVQPESPVFTSVEVEDASCTINDGVIEFEVAGGNQPYTYSIEFNGQGIFPVAQDSVAGFTAGTYQIFAEDSDGCVTDTTVTILSYNFPLIAAVNGIQPDCNSSNGSIEIQLANPPPANGS